MLQRFLKIIFESLLEVFLILLYTPLGVIAFIFSGKEETHTQVNGKTIILVEWWTNPNIIHRFWKRYLERKRFNVYLVSFSLLRGSFQESAEKLKQFIDEKKLHNITLVGLSTGSVTALLYLQEFDGWKQVKKFIAVAGPFHGTPLVLPLAFFPSVRELLPESKFLRALLSKPVKHTEKITILNAKMDEMVPLWSRILPNVKQEIIDIYGHNNLHIYSKSTYDMIARYAAEPR
ncbi:MAG: hypothetical protein HY430_01040 [Candidatus Levybacteria bacterium]|nr:hypothetical protein [Candidatus Levybacteria bacterium]